MPFARIVIAEAALCGKSIIVTTSVGQHALSFQGSRGQVIGQRDRTTPRTPRLRYWPDLVSDPRRRHLSLIAVKRIAATLADA